MSRLRFLALLAVAAMALLAAPIGGQTTQRTLLPFVAHDATPTPAAAAIRLRYRAYLQDQGWTEWQAESGIAGTPAGGRAVQAIQVELVSAPPGVGLRYRALQIDRPPPDYVGSGQTSGSIDPNGKVEALQIRLTGAPSGTTISTEVYAAGWGWLGYVREGWVAGSTGSLRPLEGFRAYVRPGGVEPARIHVAYTVNVESVGWLEWKRDGDIAGSTGQSLRLEAFGVRLFNRPEDMDIEYRAYVADRGWQEWRSGGAPAGTYGESRAIWALEMRLIRPYPGTVLTYSAHFANKGWSYFASDDPNRREPILGSIVEQFRLEAIQVTVAASQP
jgi:uncharacterized protein YjdB